MRFRAFQVDLLKAGLKPEVESSRNVWWRNVHLLPRTCPLRLTKLYLMKTSLEVLPESFREAVTYSQRCFKSMVERLGNTVNGVGGKTSEPEIFPQSQILGNQHRLDQQSSLKIHALIEVPTTPSLFKFLYITLSRLIHCRQNTSTIDVSIQFILFS
ncbi:hypothetical protein Bca101_035731 [Brassica carinata]